MPRVRIKQTPKKGQFIPNFDVLGEEIRGTDKSMKKGGKISKRYPPLKNKECGGLAHMEDGGTHGYPFQGNDGYQYYDMGGKITRMHVPDMDGNMYAGGGPTNQISYGNGSPAQDFSRYYQQNFKKGGKKKDRGGVIYPFGHNDQPKNQTWFKDRGGVIYPFGHQDQDFNHFQGFDRGGVIYPYGRYDGQETNIWDNQNFKQGGGYDQNLIGTVTNPDYLRKGGWMKGAVNPAHKGYCTPMSKSTCTGHRRAFAETMKKHHGFHKKDRGGVIYPIGGGDPESFKQGGKYIGAGPNTDLNPTTNHSISDYNPYVYFKNKNWYITSNPQDEAITGSMKAIDRDSANIEAEKGEYLVKPGLTGLYKVGGEKHSQGGTPLYAEGGSFIFSNDPKLAFSKGERDSFGFKPGSSTSKSKNTPAQVLAREINPKDYNSYIATLESPDTDRIAKTTAGLMLEKLQQKLGQIAFVQENKKNTQPPDFSQGTAPATQPEFQDIDERMSEYAYGGMYPDGGSIDPNTGLPIDPRDAYPGGNTTMGRITPKGLANNFNYPGGVPNLIKDWQGVGLDLTNMNSRDAQSAMYGWAQKNNPQLLRNMWSNYGNTAQGKEYGLNYNFDNLDDKQLGRAGDAYADGMLGARTFAPMQPRNPMGPQLPPLAQTTTPPNVTAPPPGAPSQPGTPQQSIPTLPYQIKGKLTDSQLAHLGYLGLQAFNINRYYPKRDQVSLPQVRMDQINSQPFVNQINNQAYGARQLAALNPRTASLLGSNIRGSSVDQLNQTLGNVANQNVQIGNQQNQFNTQQATQQVMYNNQADSNYYNQVQATNQNFDNERRFAGNQFMSTLNGYQSQADQLAWGLAAVNRYGNRRVVDPKTGQQYNLPTPLYQATNQGINYNGDVASMWMASGANRINTPQEINQMYQQFKQSGWDERTIRGTIDSIIRARGNQNTGQGAFYTQNPYGPY